MSCIERPLNIDLDLRFNLRLINLALSFKMRETVVDLSEDKFVDMFC